MMGIRSRIRSFPVVRELLMPQPILRHIARRAVQVAIVAAGHAGTATATATATGTAVGSGQPPGAGRPGASRTRVVLADYGRLVVTHSTSDDAVYVLRPPGEDPAAILRVARLVLPEGAYRELAGQLGLPASWPIVLADYDRLVVTCSTRDDTVYVLRPPGEDPRAVLKAARLVLPEEPYEELAEQLGVPASWPMERRCPVSPE